MIADPHLPVPPRYYGGAERIVHLFADEFVRLGHTVHLMAGPGSQSYEGRLHLHRAPSASYLSRARRKIQFQLESLWAYRGCDVVYNFGRIDYLEALLSFQVPILNCFQNPVCQDEINFLESRARSNIAFHFISNNQVDSLQVSASASTIYNPLRTKDYVCGSGNGGYLAFLGRLTSNKGVDVAIEVSRRTGKRLVIAGNISNEDGGEEFFNERVKPYLDDDQICWIGPVDELQKQNLLGDAECLLFPIRWEEPFGIVMVEALACGCPVIATRRASTPEVIDNGVTGFLCEPSEPSPDAFVEAVNHLPQINRKVCRQVAEKRFDVRIVASDVLAVLENLVNAKVDF